MRIQKKTQHTNIYSRSPNPLTKIHPGISGVSSQVSSLPRIPLPHFGKSQSLRNLSWTGSESKVLSPLSLNFSNSQTSLSEVYNYRFCPAPEVLGLTGGVQGRPITPCTPKVPLVSWEVVLLRSDVSSPMNATTSVCVVAPVSFAHEVYPDDVLVYRSCDRSLHRILSYSVSLFTYRVRRAQNPRLFFVSDPNPPTFNSPFKAGGQTSVLTQYEWISKCDVKMHYDGSVVLP